MKQSFFIHSHLFAVLPLVFFQTMASHFFDNILSAISTKAAENDKLVSGREVHLLGLLEEVLLHCENASLQGSNPSGKLCIELIYKPMKRRTVDVLVIHLYTVNENCAH